MSIDAASSYDDGSDDNGDGDSPADDGDNNQLEDHQTHAPAMDAQVIQDVTQDDAQ